VPKPVRSSLSRAMPKQTYIMRHSQTIMDTHD